MKKLFSLVAMILLVGLVSVSAQNFKYTVKASSDCTNRTAEFTVPAGKTAKLMSMDIVPTWTSCNAAQTAPTEVSAKVYLKTSGSKPKILYKQTVVHDGGKAETTPIQDVKLMEGTYILEISAAPNAEATLEIKLATN
jgi:hypothetical protein